MFHWQTCTLHLLWPGTVNERFMYNYCIGHSIMDYMTYMFYRMGGKFGGEFNLAVWRIMNALPNQIPVKFPAIRYRLRLSC